MLAKIKAFFMENIDGVAVGVGAMYGVDIHHITTNPGVTS